MIAALCQEVSETEDELGLSALEEVNPGGHLLAAHILWHDIRMHFMSI